MIIDAQPGAALGNGSASLAMRYRYRGITLDYYDYQKSKALLRYLQQDKAYVRDLGLHPTHGHWYNGGYPESGHTLYLSPAQFGAEEVERLADCIKSNKFKLKDAFINTKIYGRAYFGLAQTRSRVKYDGIAHLVHKDNPPFFDTYYMSDNGALLMVIERGGRVLLYGTYNDKKYPDEVVVWGKMLAPTKARGKSRLFLHPVTVNPYGKPKIYDSEKAKWWVQRYEKKYDIFPQ